MEITMKDTVVKKGTSWKPVAAVAFAIAAGSGAALGFGMAARPLLQDSIRKNLPEISANTPTTLGKAYCAGNKLGDLITLSYQGKQFYMNCP
jgi:hypothetical protein